MLNKSIYLSVALPGYSVTPPDSVIVDDKPVAIGWAIIHDVINLFIYQPYLADKESYFCILLLPGRG